jgi:hypothetical protein
VRVLAPLVALALCGPNVAAPSEDFQLWSELGVEAPLGARFRVAAHAELRFFEDASRLGLHNYDVGVAWLQGERFALSLHFLEEFEREGDRVLAESRPYADALLRATLLGLDLSNRARVEWRLREDRPDLVRLRNRLQLVAPWSLGPRGPRPFLAEEVLFETKGRGFDQNRAMLGLVARFGGLTASGYGMLLSQKRDRWEHTPVLGFSFTWSVAGPPMMSGDR